MTKDGTIMWNLQQLTEAQKTVTLAKTCAACVEQPEHRVIWAANTVLNRIVIGIKYVANSYAETDGPKD
jgi:hypothetical protein